MSKRMGEIAEDKVKLAIEELKEELKKEGKGEINSWRKSDKLSRKDMKGVDFSITYTTNQGKKIVVLLQVKSKITERLVEKLELKEIKDGIWYKRKERIYNIEAGGKKKRRKIKEKISKILEIEEKKNQRENL